MAHPTPGLAYRRVQKDAERVKEPMDVEVVVVAYRSRPLVERLLGRLAPDVPVVVVDNVAGADGLPEVVAARPGARYLPGPGLGFAVAANLGARTSLADHLVFVNPDTDPDAAQLAALVDDLRVDPALAGVAATTVLPDGTVELGVGGWEPTPLRCLVHALGVHRLLPAAGLYARPRPGVPMRPDWLSGACLAVPRATFLSLGGFDERYVVYNEDMAYGRRARETGHRLRLRTDVLVPHAGAGSGEGREVMFRRRGASMAAYLGHHNPARDVAVMRALLTLATLLRAGRALLLGRWGQARAHRAYLAGLWRGPAD